MFLFAADWIAYTVSDVASIVAWPIAACYMANVLRYSFGRWFTATYVNHSAAPKGWNAIDVD